MLLFASIAGLVLSAILVYFNAKKFNSAIYLGGFFFLFSLYGLILHVLFYSKSIQWIAFFYINFTFLLYLTGPLFYFYFRSVLNDHSGFKRKDLWHFLPAVVFFIASVPHLFSSWSVKMDAAASIVENTGYLGRNNPTLLIYLIPNVLVYLSRPVLVLVYIFLSAWIFTRYLKNNRESSVFTSQQYMIKWLVSLLVFLFILSVSHILVLSEAFANRSSDLFFTFNVLQTFSAIGLAGLLISPFFFPGILYGLPRFPQPIADYGFKHEKVYRSGPGTNRKIQTLESDYLLLIAEKIDHCMKEQQPFLEPSCNLAAVARLIHIPAHHLAYYFREEKKQSFNDFKNELRVRHAKKLIKEGKTKELTLEAIGQLSGFSTRNTFFMAFKKVEGISPGAYSSKVSERIVG